MSKVELGVVVALRRVTIKVKIKGGKTKQVKIGTRKIATALKRSRATIVRAIQKKTHAKPRGRPLKWSEADVERAKVELARLRKKFKGLREVTYTMVKVASAFPASETVLRRCFARHGLSARPLREKLTLSKTDVDERHAWARCMMLRPVVYWQVQVIFTDCKCYRAHLSETQVAFQRARAVRFVIRTRAEGLLPECTRPGKGHSPGVGGTEKIFCAVAAGVVMCWIAYRKWCGDTAVKCMRELWKACRLRWPTQRSFVVCHDNDPTGFRSGKCKDAQRRFSFEIIYLPKRSPLFMPLDFTLWRQIERRMNADRDAAEVAVSAAGQPRVSEAVAAWRKRLRATALGTPAEAVNTALASVHTHAQRVAAAGGLHVEEGRRGKAKAQ